MYSTSSLCKYRLDFVDCTVLMPLAGASQMRCAMRAIEPRLASFSGSRPGRLGRRMRGKLGIYSELAVNLLFRALYRPPRLRRVDNSWGSLDF